LSLFEQGSILSYLSVFNLSKFNTQYSEQFIVPAQYTCFCYYFHVFSFDFSTDPRQTQVDFSLLFCKCFVFCCRLCQLFSNLISFFDLQQQQVTFSTYFLRAFFFVANLSPIIFPKTSPFSDLRQPQICNKIYLLLPQVEKVKEFEISPCFGLDHVACSGSGSPFAAARPGEH